MDASAKIKLSDEELLSQMRCVLYTILSLSPPLKILDTLYIGQSY